VIVARGNTGALAASAAAAAMAAAAPANPERGESEIVLAGVTYRLRPSNTAIDKIERDTGKGLIPLVNGSGAGELTTRELAIAATELIRAGAEKGDSLTRAVSVDRIRDLILEEGVPGVMARVSLCLLDAATGGRTASGEPKAAGA
jgi:hypothetical protein